MVFYHIPLEHTSRHRRIRKNTKSVTVGWKRRGVLFLEEVVERNDSLNHRAVGVALQSIAAYQGRHEAFLEPFVRPPALAEKLEVK